MTKQTNQETQPLHKILLKPISVVLEVQEQRQQRQLQAAKNCRQGLKAEPQEQRLVRLEADRETTAETTATDIRAKRTSSCSKKTKETAEERVGIGLSQGILPT